MSDTSIFRNWKEQNGLLWGQIPQRIQHNLHESPLFQREALGELIEKYPREHYSLVYMGAQGDRRFWREGDIGGLSGTEVIDAIENGRMWLNLRSVKTVDQRYARLVKDIFGEIGQRVPDFSSFDEGVGILISSPKAQVYYHIDLPGQALWQISGSKRVYVYPAAAPFLTPQQLESVALFEIEVDVPYEKWYDDHAMVVDLQPGEMLHWPLNAPHRVENHDCLNISMTLEYWSDEIRRSHIVNMANGLLRHRFGMTPQTRETHGPIYAGKAAMQGLMRRAGWVKRARRSRRPIDFTLDRAKPGAILDLAAAV
ncbi:MAG: cupin-like domain-containing protein [Beijerinckiaceae bacterium]